MNILVIGNRYCNPESSWLETANMKDDYTFYIIPYGNYINYYDILTRIYECNIIEQYEHIVIQGENDKHLCFYQNNWIQDLLEYPSDKKNFKFYAADGKYLVWQDNIFHFMSEQKDALLEKYDMTVSEAQAEYLQFFTNNNELATVMQGSKILLNRKLDEIGIPYTFIKEIKNENLDIRTAR